MTTLLLSARASLATIIGVLGTLGCASTPPPAPAPGQDLSAQQHEALAKQDEHASAEHSSKYDPKADDRHPHCDHGGTAHTGFDDCWISVVNPTAHHREEAREHLRSAAAHRAASQALRDAEAKACVGVADIDRDESPFAHREDILRVFALPRGAQASAKPEGGVVVFRAVPTLSAPALQKILDCHLARNAAAGYDMPEMTYCPLVPKGVTATAQATSEGFEVEIRSADEASAREVWRRVQALGPH